MGNGPSNINMTKPCNMNSGKAVYIPGMWQDNQNQHKYFSSKEFEKFDKCSKCKLMVPSSLDCVAMDMGADKNTRALILFSTEDKGMSYTVMNSWELGAEVGKEPKITGKVGGSETTTINKGSLLAKFFVIRKGKDLAKGESQILSKILENKNFCGDGQMATTVAQMSIVVPARTHGQDHGRLTGWTFGSTDCLCMKCYIQSCNKDTNFKPSFAYTKTLFAGNAHIIADGKRVLP